MAFEPLNWDDKIELYKAAVLCFQNKEISEEQFRIRLARLGYNASEIEQEVETYRPLKDK